MPEYKDRDRRHLHLLPPQLEVKPEQAPPPGRSWTELFDLWFRGLASTDRAAANDKRAPQPTAPELQEMLAHWSGREPSQQEVLAHFQRQSLDEVLDVIGKRPELKTPAMPTGSAPIKEQRTPDRVTAVAQPALALGGKATATAKAPPAPAYAPAPSLTMSLLHMRTTDIPKESQGGISYRTVSGPVHHDPGGYVWVVQWKLNAASPKGGWIVQHVVAQRDVQDKSGKVLKAGEDKRFGYWEAWQVNKGKDITNYAEGGDFADDTYASPAEGPETKGKVEVTGRAEFYEDLKLPAEFAPDETSPAGILPIVRSTPALAGGTGSISHSMSISWDATKGDKTTTIKIH